MNGEEEPKEAPKEDGTISLLDKTIEKLVEGKGDVLTQIIDNTSFTVGGETYEEGDKVDLKEVEEVIFAAIQRLNKENKEIKQWLLNKCHSTTRKLIPEIRPVAHVLAKNSIEMREKVALLINMMHARLGGMLPMKLDDAVSEFTVRAVGQGESLNYTVAHCLALIGITPLNAQRELSFRIARNREDSYIDMGQNIRLKFQPIVVRDFMWEDRKDESTFEKRLIAGVMDFLKDNPRTSKTLIMLDADLAHIINMDIKEEGRWERILEYTREVEPHIIYVLETIPGKDPKKTEAALSCMYKERDESRQNLVDLLIKKTWKFQVRVAEKRVKKTDEIEGEFHSKPEDQYEDLLIS